MKDHMMKVHREKKFLCDQCHMAFVSPSYLRDHQWKHAEPTFECEAEGCTFKTTSDRYLRLHVQRAHTVQQEERFKCEEENCSYETNKKRNLKNHVKSKHKKVNEK